MRRKHGAIKLQKRTPQALTAATVDLGRIGSFDPIYLI
jgi:hypothetical protein